MQFADIQTTWQVVSSLLAAVVLFGGASAAVYKFCKWATKPIDDNTERITAIEERQDRDNRRISRLEDMAEETGKESKILLSCILQLMNHEIDGNHTAQLTAARDELAAFLINK